MTLDNRHSDPCTGFLGHDFFTDPIKGVSTCIHCGATKSWPPSHGTPFLEYESARDYAEWRWQWDS